MHDPDDELVSRAETRRMLGGIGKEKLVSLEREGRLRKVRLSTSAKGRIFYITREIKALMQPEVVSPGRAVPLKRRLRER